ncbi:MAG TPA: cupredoxin family copper-binding protein [Noviherbaspirillum sp.]|nr:cupredoxin family copper-binding protein [Noviherbaspirillum sp.]
MHGFTRWRGKGCQVQIALFTCMALSVASSTLHAEAKVHTVVIEAMRYAPEVIEVNVGDTVIWKNQDPFPHTATAEDRSFDSGEIASNGTGKFVASRKGIFPYVCTLHPTMKAKLLVR